MKLTKQQNLKINLVLERFDFNKVEKAMEATAWLWYKEDGTYYYPYPEELRNRAENLLEDCIETGYASCGGLTATYENKEFKLVFELEESDSET